jgi:hypothetical protein
MRHSASTSIAVLYTAPDAQEFEQTCAELQVKGVPLEDGCWGKALMIVTYRDGNQIWFARPDKA